MFRTNLLLLLLVIFLNANSQDFIYPEAKKETVTDTFFKEYLVDDEYRWMENINDTALITWINAQNKISKKELHSASIKNQAFNTIDKYSYTKFTRPIKKGKYYFTYAYYNSVSLPALFYKQNLNLRSELIVDPNYISLKDQIRLKGCAVSKDSKYLAYQFSRNGSDWAEIKVVNLENKDHLVDHLVDVKFSNIAWKGNGFFYSKYPRKDKFSPTLGEEIYYHELRTDQSKDKLVFKRNNPNIQFYITVTSDERYFILKEYNKDTYQRNVFFIDYNSSIPAIKPLLMNLKDEISIIDCHNGKLIATTLLNSNTGYVVEIDPQDPYNLKAIIPEYEKAVLLEIKPLNEKIIAIYQYNQRPIITVYDYIGNLLYSLEIPVGHSVAGFSGNMDDTELIFYLTAYTLPPVAFKFNTIDYKRTLLQHTGVTFDFENIVTEEVEYYTEDSIKVPMFIIHHKDMELNGNNPTILKAYGGFGSIVQPHYDPGIVYFVNKGGVFAYANIRGGGDNGYKWHEQGRRENKQNSFDDFIAAAEYLIESKYTNSKKLAITGGSNGGLVVAASAIQRPDLFNLVVPVVGVFDMIRDEKFTVGNLHTDEFGTVKDSTSFINILSYSPLHNIRDDINYPGMLIITSENDERVPPFNSYKFTAKLQNREAQQNPIILKVVKNAGHYGSIGWITDIRETAEVYGYIYKYLKETE
ncbi:prolyl oligopeptidase family serine peptidase [Bacteroidota bacterium]